MFLLISPYWLSVTLHNFICRICYLENARLQRGVPFMCMCVLPSMCMCVHAPQRATVDLHKTAPGKLHNTFGMCCTLLQWLSSSIHQHHGAVSLYQNHPCFHPSLALPSLPIQPSLLPIHFLFTLVIPVSILHPHLSHISDHFSPHLTSTTLHLPNLT